MRRLYLNIGNPRVPFLPLCRSQLRAKIMRTHARSLLTDRACYTAITKIPTVQLMYSTTPLAISIAFQRNHVKFIFVAIAALVVFSQPGIIYSHLPNPPPAQHFRFRNLQARNGSPAKEANIENLRILFNGSPISTSLCELTGLNTMSRGLPTSDIPDTSLVISCRAPVEWNGWAFDTASLGAVENDPTVFYFEYESDGRWLTGGGSSRVYFCGVLSFPPLAYGTCRPRGCSNIFRDLQPYSNIELVLETVDRWFSGLFLLLPALELVTIQQFAYGLHTGLACLYSAAFLILLVGGATLHLSLEHTGDMDVYALLRLLLESIQLSLDCSILPPFFVGAFHFMTGRMYWDDLRRTGRFSMFAKLAFWSSFVLCGGYLLDGSPSYGQKVVLTACLELGIPLFVFALVALLSAHINCYGVRTILLNTYKGLWPLAHPQAEAEMRTLERFVIEQIEPCIQKEKSVNPPMQCWTPAQRSRYYRTSGIGGHCGRGSSIFEEGIQSSLPENLCEQFQAVTSLGYLFRESNACEPALRERVFLWASRCGGYLMHTKESHSCSMRGGDGGGGFDVDANGGGCSLFVRARNVDIQCNCIKWSPPKTIERAVEKAIRCYNGNVSELLDVCRQLIVFDTISDIHRCLEEIHNDKTVRIVRIKNRLTPDYNANEITAGYRDVALNIRISGLLLHTADNDHYMEEEEEEGGRKSGENLRSRRGRRRKLEDRGEEEDGSGTGGGDEADSEDMPLYGRGDHPSTEHICEVQLIPREFALARLNSGHKHYIQFRNTTAG